MKQPINFGVLVWFAAVFFLIGGAVIVLLAADTRKGRLDLSSLREFFSLDARRALAGFRFLCPHCRRFGPAHCACRRCGVHVDWEANRCGACGVEFFPPVGERTPGFLAFCLKCGKTCDAETYHQREIRVVGTLLPGDGEAFRRASEYERWSGDERALWVENGVQLFCVLNLAEGDEFERDPAHAVQGVQAIWLDGAAANPLDLGEALDRFIRRAGLSEVRRKEFPVCVGTPQAPKGVRNTVESRFRNVHYGVTPEEVLFGRFSDTAHIDPSAPEYATEVRSLAVLNSWDYSTLSGVTDDRGHRLLRSRSEFRDGEGKLVRVLTLDRVRKLAEDPAFDFMLDGLEALWIDGPGWDARELAAAADRLIAAAGLTEERRQGFVACLADARPHPAVRNVLSRRFGLVVTGVSAGEFLRRGAGSVGVSPGGGVRTHTLLALTAADVEALWEAMDPRTRRETPEGPLLEEAPDRATYVLDGSGARGMPAHFGLGSSPDEVEALWLDGREAEPLALGESLDRGVRTLKLGEERWRGMPVFVGAAELAPAARNVLEGRFPRVVYGVGAREFLTWGASARARSHQAYDGKLRVYGQRPGRR